MDIPQGNLRDVFLCAFHRATHTDNVIGGIRPHVITDVARRALLNQETQLAHRALAGGRHRAYRKADIGALTQFDIQRREEEMG